MKLRKCDLEVAHANTIVHGACNFLRPVVHCVELADFVPETDPLEQRPDFFASSQLSEVGLADTHFSLSRWEQKINGLRFVTIIL